MPTLIFTGRLGQDAKIKTVSGTDLCSFSVGTDVGYGDKKRTLWIDCAMWGERGRKVEPYLRKGGIVEVVGEPSVRAYDKDGPQASLQCRVMELKLHGGPREDKPVADNARATSRDDNDSIPF